MLRACLVLMHVTSELSIAHTCSVCIRTWCYRMLCKILMINNLVKELQELLNILQL